jgi:hypothetical protein
VCEGTPAGYYEELEEVTIIAEGSRSLSGTPIGVGPELGELPRLVFLSCMLIGLLTSGRSRRSGCCWAGRIEGAGPQVTKVIPSWLIFHEFNVVYGKREPFGVRRHFVDNPPVLTYSGVNRLQKYVETGGHNLTTNTLSTASQELVSPQALEFVQELLRPFVTELGQVREQLGAERARREMAEEKAATLEAELEALRAPERDAEMPMGPTPAEASEEAQEGAEPRRSFWARLFGG